MPFGAICFNEAGVRLYHDLAKQTPVFCDATGRVVSLPKDSCNKKPTLYYYALVVKHPILHKPPIAVAELITADHTVLSISFFLQHFRRAESLLFVCYFTRQGDGAALCGTCIHTHKHIYML